MTVTSGSDSPDRGEPESRSHGEPAGVAALLERLNALPRPLVGAVLLLLFVSVNGYIYWDEPGEDLASTYLAGAVLNAGHGEHLYAHHPSDFSRLNHPVWLQAARDREFRHYLHPYVHAPLWAHAARPLAKWVKFPAFSSGFLLVSLTATFALFWFAALAFYPVLTRPHWALLCLVLVSLSEPFRYTCYLNQTHPLALCGIMLAIYGTMKGRPYLAGISLAVAAALKLTPALLVLYWLLTGKWKEVRVFVVVGLALAGLSIALGGWEAHVAFLENARRIGGGTLTMFNNLSFTGALTRALTRWDQVFNFSLHDSVAWIDALNLALAAATLGWIIVRVRFLRRNGRESDCFGMLSLVLLVLFYSKLTWSHYYLALVMPFVAVAPRLAKSGFWSTASLQCCVALALMFRPLAVDMLEIERGMFGVVNSSLWAGLLLFGRLSANSHGSRLWARVVNTGLIGFLVGITVVRGTTDEMPFGFNVVEMGATSACISGRGTARLSWELEEAFPHILVLEARKVGIERPARFNVRPAGTRVLHHLSPGEYEWRLVGYGRDRYWRKLKVASDYRRFAVNECVPQSPVSP